MSPTSAYYASQLRHELTLRNRAFAVERRLSHVESYGGMGITVYQPHLGQRRHGNFFDPSYACIVANAAWRKRLDKVHTSGRSSLPRSTRGWKELDSSMSSDALLMNIFCCPHVVEDARMLALLGIDEPGLPDFGFRARVPLKTGHADRTEVDMKLGDLLFEAKLTETAFQPATIMQLACYRDFEEVFDLEDLPQEKGTIAGYQLIRNVLAAHALNLSFCLLVDARRPDLLESWYAVTRCVRQSELRLRCKVLTWQELSVALPEPLANFLDHKYGIVPPGQKPSPIRRDISADPFDEEAR